MPAGIDVANPIKLKTRREMFDVDRSARSIVGIGSGRPAASAWAGRIAGAAFRGAAVQDAAP